MNSMLDHLEIVIKSRQRMLWLKVVELFEVEDRLNIQVQNWINKGQVSENAYRRFPNLRIAQRAILIGKPLGTQ